MNDPISEPKRNQSARALLWLAGILILVGMTVMSPSGGLLCYVLAALSSVPAILLVRGKVRVISMVMTIGAVIMAAVIYPASKTDMDQYRQRIESRSSGTNK